MKKNNENTSYVTISILGPVKMNTDSIRRETIKAVGIDPYWEVDDDNTYIGGSLSVEGIENVEEYCKLLVKVIVKANNGPFTSICINAITKYGFANYLFYDENLPE